MRYRLVLESRLWWWWQDSIRPSSKLLVAALATSILTMLLIDPFRSLGRGDDAFYLETANNFINGCYCFYNQPTTFRPPGYTMFVALFGALPGVVVWAQFVLLALAAWLTYRTLWLFDRKIAWISGLLIATSPFLFAYASKIMAETLYGVLIWIAWLVLYQAKQWPGWLAAGGLMGMAILTRDTLLLLPAFFVCLSLFRREWLRRSLIAAVAAYALAIPWQFHVDPKDSRLGLQLWMGTWERDPHWLDGKTVADFTGYPDYAFSSPEQRKELGSALAQSDDGPFRAAARERIINHPVGVVKVWTLRYPWLWVGTRLEQVDLRFERQSPAWIAVKAIAFALNLLLLALGSVGLWLSRKTSLAIFAVPIAYVALIYIPFHNIETRYTLLALPSLYLFSAVALCRYGLDHGKIKNWRFRRSDGSGSVHAHGE